MTFFLAQVVKINLKKALKILDELLAFFNLSLDHSKTHFIRSSKDLPDFIDILYNRDSESWEYINAETRLK